MQIQTIFQVTYGELQKLGLKENREYPNIEEKLREAISKRIKDLSAKQLVPEWKFVSINYSHVLAKYTVTIDYSKPEKKG